MNQEITLSLDQAFSQVEPTADKYLRESYKILKDSYEDFTVSDAIELAKVMASDFNSTMLIIKLQEIRDKLEKLSDDID